MANSERKKLNREERRSLDIEIDFLARLTRRAPDYVEALEVLAHDYTLRGRYADGLQVDERLANLRPENPLVHYNLACSYALTDQPELAFESLNRAIDRGYREFRWLARDPDLATFRKHPLYRKLRGRIRAMQVPVD
ncbi:MAG: hypothetical protein KDM81_18225 [Verrucomicrobiae bacterium]|nr:hypothetical protein [Verrucomicrobiae bacterium]MCP5518515.1 hypothetical protein [Verrucomicrobiales bacterium]MCP5528405.1 hypothetical protein [Verrucomicrobiales bacterium]